MERCYINIIIIINLVLANISCVRFEQTNMLKKWLLAVDLWLSAGQLEHYFRLSGACFGCSGQMDNQNFDHYTQ